MVRAPLSPMYPAGAAWLRFFGIVLFLLWLKGDANFKVAGIPPWKTPQGVLFEEKIVVGYFGLAIFLSLLSRAHALSKALSFMKGTLPICTNALTSALMPLRPGFTLSRHFGL